MNNYSLKNLSSLSPVDQNTLDKVFWEEMRSNYNPTEKLYHAVCNGTHTDMQLLISQGADVNKKDVDGNSLVYIAAIKGYLDVLKILVSHSANVEIGDVNGCKPIYAAVLHNQMNVVKYLVQVGANLEPYGAILMHNAAINNNIILINLLNYRGVDVNITNEYGCAALHYAAQYEQLDSIKHLISKGAKIDMISRDGSTPLNYAMICDKFYSIVLLCSLGANMERDFWFFKMNDINQIFFHGLLAERLSAALNVYNTFFKRDECFKHNLLSIISNMVEIFEKEWNYHKIKVCLGDKNFNSLREVIYQVHNLSRSYSHIKNKLKKSKIAEDWKVQEVLERSDLNTLLNSLEKYQFELVKKALFFNEIKIKLPSLLRINDIVSEVEANFTTEELASLSDFTISDLLQVAAPFKSDVKELNLISSSKNNNYAGVVEMLDLCSPFYLLGSDE